MTCKIKIRPFRTVNETELTCQVAGAEPHQNHHALLLDYAYPGSVSDISWVDEDRRCFKGEFTECPVGDCILPKNHWGKHAGPND